MDADQILRKFRKKPIALPAEFPGGPVLGRADLEKLLPHRFPFLLLDSIAGVDLARAVIVGRRRIDPSDPVLAGHFPGCPVYPGSLQLEMTGQLGLCLYHFVKSNSLVVPEKAGSMNVRATRVLGAHYLLPVMPGAEVIVTAMRLDSDEYFGTIVGQVISDSGVCSVSISEVCFVE